LALQSSSLTRAALPQRAFSGVRQNEVFRGADTPEKLAEVYDRWAATFKADTPEKLAEVYDKWGATYDTDVKDKLAGDGINHPVTQLLEHLRPHVVEAQSILDCGCGTGDAGPMLAEHFKPETMVALDLSQGMLAMAKARPQQGGYTHFVQAQCPDLGDAKSMKFDLVFCAGTFIPNHAPPETLRSCLEVVRPGGFISFSVRKYYFEEESSGFRALQEKLVAEQRWELVSREERPYLPKENVTAFDFTYKVL
jgi:ubiquinone/menaquinone biosynthesis C-methylase UbiE